MDKVRRSLQTVFTKNRSEELGYDVWENFVVPPFYDRLDLQTARKPRVIIGGRGCGKTMLLRYLSHQSMFSPKRKSIPDDAISHIGLYWRADTQFANAMMRRGIDDDKWAGAFNHMLAVILGTEVLASLQSIADSRSQYIEPKDIVGISFSELQAFNPLIPSAYVDLRAYLEQQLWQLQAWVSDTRKAPEPHFLPGRHFLLALISLIKRQLPRIKDANFFVYLDEYENLLEYQQKEIHTCLKHSEAKDSLIFNLAVKRNALTIRKTVGPESIADIHDWRQHDLEEYLLEDNFPLFAAEILFLNLAIANIGTIPISIEDLRDPLALERRQTKEYSDRALFAVRNLFPGLSEEQLANGLFADEVLVNKLRRRIVQALKERKEANLGADAFLSPDKPRASIVAPALLHRSNLSPAEVYREFEQHKRGEPNRFSGDGGWIHNNFIGCLLHLYEPNSRACPFYAGFDAFCQLSHGNIRHFLELCHKSINQGFRRDGLAEMTVQPNDQAEAARQVSTSFLGEVRSFGNFGNKLHAFVLRLGSLFALAHRRPTQSEPEQSHFAMGRGNHALSEEDEMFIREAVKWSVLFEEASTKKKDEFQPEGYEYVLNPIYAPYFNITYRKKRKLDLKTDEVIVLIRGSYEDVTNLLKAFSKQWTVDLSGAEADSPLFSHLQSGGGA